MLRGYSQFGSAPDLFKLFSLYIEKAAEKYQPLRLKII